MDEPELRPVSPGRSGVGWECLLGMTPEPSLAGAEGVGGGWGRQSGWCALTVHLAVHPLRAARAFGEYLSQSHPENRNGAGRGTRGRARTWSTQSC